MEVSDVSPVLEIPDAQIFAIMFGMSIISIPGPAGATPLVQSQLSPPSAVAKAAASSPPRGFVGPAGRAAGGARSELMP
jgi:hypothetical protein